MNDEKKITFETGSVRNELNNVRYDLISPVALRRLAETYALGAAKYDDRNWEKGQPFSVLLNHALDHINCYIAEQRGILTMKGKEQGEDHIAHAVWNLFSLMHFQEVMPELNDVRVETNMASELKIEETEETEDQSKHYFLGATDKPCLTCRAPRDDEIHYQRLDKGVPSVEDKSDKAHAFKPGVSEPHLCLYCGDGAGYPIHTPPEEKEHRR